MSHEDYALFSTAVVLTSLVFVVIFQNYPTAIVFAVASLCFMFTVYETNKRLSIEEDASALDVLKYRLQDIEAKFSEIETGAVAVFKQAEETKKLLSNYNLTQAFAPRKGVPHG